MRLGADVRELAVGVLVRGGAQVRELALGHLGRGCSFEGCDTVGVGVSIDPGDALAETLIDLFSILFGPLSFWINPMVSEFIIRYLNYPS